MNGKYTAASRRLGVPLGLNDIWSDWSLTDHAGLQEKLGQPWNDNFDRDLACWVVGRCPELLERCIGPYELYDAAMGIISQYILEDITYFMSHRNHLTRPKSLVDRWEVLHNKVPLVNWVPCEKTIEKLERAILHSAIPESIDRLIWESYNIPTMKTKEFT